MPEDTAEFGETRIVKVATIATTDCVGSSNYVAAIVDLHWRGFEPHNVLK